MRRLAVVVATCVGTLLAGSAGPAAALRPEPAGSAPSGASGPVIETSTGPPGPASPSTAPPATAPAPWARPPTAGDSAGTGRWAWPLSPRTTVQRRFAAPESAWGAGHRGLDLTGRGGQDVLAVEDGVVSHVGVIAGSGTATIRHRDGLRSTYEPVEPTVGLGQRVGVGEVVGRLSAGGSHCAPAACLHLGARVDAAGGGPSAYVDPEPLLLRRRVILLPMH